MKLGKTWVVFKTKDGCSLDEEEQEKLFNASKRLMKKFSLHTLKIVLG